jgi:type IV secretory pathway VirB2 component (pilin)
MAFNLKSKYLFFILSLLFLFSIAFPAIVFAACTPCPDGSLVCCGNAGNPPCTIDDAFCLITNIVNFILFQLAPILAVIWFSFAGFTYLTSAGDPGKVKKAKDMIIYVVVGLLIAYLAWGIIYSFIQMLGGDTNWLLQFFSNPTE